MPSEERLVAQMHQLLLMLSRRGVLTLLSVAQHGIVGSALAVPVDVSYQADTVLLLRHFEAGGALRQALNVYKKRYGFLERRIREVRLQPGGIQIGAPLSQFTGILSGVPSYVGEDENLIEANAQRHCPFNPPKHRCHIVLSARVGRNATVLRQVLESQGLVCISAPTVQAVADAIQTGAALIVMTEEVLFTEQAVQQLTECLSRQPEWSAIPVILLLISRLSSSPTSLRKPSRRYSTRDAA
ncbi:hypothetical protein [Vasconcelosia minhoensis]|uniref:hypothetical protein n=1 Tax=Vasconcelosia minhoensis TaxID=3366354 RepID=UPI001D140DDE|nr:hypothetical protein [Romeria gracilis]